VKDIAQIAKKMASDQPIHKRQKTDDNAVHLILSRSDVLDLASALTNRRVQVRLVEGGPTLSSRKLDQRRRNALVKILEVASGLEGLGTVALNLQHAKPPPRSAATSPPPPQPPPQPSSLESILPNPAAATTHGGDGFEGNLALADFPTPGDAAFAAAEAAEAAEDGRLEAAWSRSVRRRVGILGCGDIALSYVASLQRAGCRVVAVFDPDEERCRTVAAAVTASAAASAVEHSSGPCNGTDTTGYPSCVACVSQAEFLSDALGVALVANLTPPRLHHATTRVCLEAGKHVWSEKPLAMKVSATGSKLPAFGLLLICTPVA